MATASRCYQLQRLPYSSIGLSQRAARSQYHSPGASPPQCLPRHRYWDGTMTPLFGQP